MYNKEMTFDHCFVAPLTGCYGSHLILCLITYICLTYLLRFSKCQSQWHVTVSTSYIKWTAFLIIVVARIPLRQFSLDYD